MSLTLYNCRNLIYMNSRRLNIIASSKNNTRRLAVFTDSKSNSVPTSQTSSILRFLSTQPQPDSNSKPAYSPLMKFPEVTWPNFFQMIKCWLIFKLGLPSLDKDFDLTEFIDGSQQAIYVVSSALSREDYDGVEGLVTPEAIEILRENISRMGDEQKREICLEKKEFFFCFPWTINVTFGADRSTKIVEVVMVYHLLRNWKDPEIPSKLFQSDSGMQRLNIMHETVSSPEYLSHTIVGNYRFVREFGSADKSWSINIVNQFRLCDAEK